MTTTHLMSIYPKRLPVTFMRGEGVWLWDNENNQYLDALAGIAVCGLGHAHPEITATITKQAGKLLHVSNTYHIAEQEELADALAGVSGMDQVFFSNSGAEAIEACIKMTRLFARKKNIDNPVIITMNDAFHGRTIGAINASSARLQENFEPLLPTFVRVNFNNIENLQQTIERHQSNIVAILLEPIQGDGGIREVSAEFLGLIRRICNEKNWLMILDEIQTGLCRTGEWFYFQHTKIKPDVMTLAKTLANGLPIGAYLTQGKANNLFQAGQHGSTFGGNPFVCAVALKVLKILERDNFAQVVASIGHYLKEKLQATFNQHAHVIKIKGRGLMLGVELDKPCRDITLLGLKHRLLFNVVDNKTIRLLPPLILKESEADQICLRLRKIVDEFYTQ